MTLRGRSHLARPLGFVIAMIALSGCMTTTPDQATGRYAVPLGGAPVIANETPYSDALRCMARYTMRHPLHVAVGQIADYTGKTESDNSGRKITQGGALMAMSALAKAGVPLVERFDTSVAELELKYANNKLIGNEKTPGAPGDYRKIFAGSIPGSDYYLVGGITELNFNIYSEGGSADGGQTATDGVKGTAGISSYVMNIGLDLRLVDTNTLEVVDVISYQKQIIGHQEQAGVFDFLGHSFFDASIGDSALEPVQLAVRSTIERAVLEMVSRLYKAPGGGCASNLGTSADPLAGPGDGPRPPAPRYIPTEAAAPRPAPTEAVAMRPMPPDAAPQRFDTYQPDRRMAASATTTQEHRNDSSDQDPYRFYSSSDPASEPRLRRRID
jgi:curli biogenesis system outer membrane secretion channel CsgG